MRPRPEPQVLDWFSALGTRIRFVISAVTQTEILLGIGLLPAGKKRSALASAAEGLFTQEFDGMTLAFDAQAAPVYAAIAVTRIQRGTPMSVEDAQIAAIAVTHRLVLATRNTRDFVDVPGLELINPWEAHTA